MQIYSDEIIFYHDHDGRQHPFNARSFEFDAKWGRLGRAVRNSTLVDLTYYRVHTGAYDESEDAINDECTTIEFWYSIPTIIILIGIQSGHNYCRNTVGL
jgi:hypothetical protein